MENIEKDFESKMKQEKENEKNSEWDPHYKPRFGSRMSYEEVIYDMITEIPHYFDLDNKFHDDSKVIEIKRKKTSRRESDKSTRSISRRKSIREAIKRKSIFNNEAEKDILLFKVNNNFIQDNISKSEIVFEKEKALFKLGEGNMLYQGTAIITDFRFIFNFDDSKCYENLKLSKDYFIIPIFTISKLEKIIDKKSYDRYSIEIHTKDNRQMKFIIVNEDLKFFKIIGKFAFPPDDNKFLLFPFKFCGDYKKNNKFEIEGWKIYDMSKELNRELIDVKQDKSRYRISKINKKFELAPSYPKFIVVPRFINDSELKESSNFRTRGRLPILSFQYKENKCCIWRCSQPRTGLTHQRCAADERLLKMAIDYTEKLVVFDARPYLNALANRLKGGGFEIVENYHKCEIKFCEIDNIHAVSASFQKLISLLSISKIKENKKYYSELEKTGWLEFLSLIIKISTEIALTVKNGSTVLIHCSDGWDRSSQLASLAQLLLDPYFRTLEGFIVLIEKDWLSFGHQFAYRNGHYTKDLGEDQRSQVFLQWLDCVHQILTQFPYAFEFNLELLNFIAANFNTCLYGTFLFNNDREREEFDAKNRTISIWTDVMKNENIKRFINPFYSHYSKELIPSYGYYKIRLWEEFYFQYFQEEIGLTVINKGSVENIKTRINYFESKKLEDQNQIQKQNETIESLKDIIKDLSSVVTRNHLGNQLTESTRNYIENLNSFQKISDEKVEKLETYNKVNTLKLEMHDNYVNQK